MRSPRGNLAARLRLLRLALFKRFIYDDILEMAADYGPPIGDVRGNLGPAELLARISDRSEFTVADFPELTADRIIVEEGETINWSSEPSVARFLGHLTVLKRAATVLEIGCFIGWTTSHIAAALRLLGPEGRVHYLEADSRHLATATSNLQRLGLQSWAVPHLGLSTDPQALAGLPAQADIVFIDTTHQFEQTCAEIESYAPRLAPRGCLVLHDSISIVGVRRAVEHMRDRFDVATFATERSNGVSVLVPRHG